MLNPSYLSSRAIAPFRLATQKTRPAWERKTRPHEPRQIACTLEELEWTATSISQNEINLILQHGLFNFPAVNSGKSRNDN